MADDLEPQLPARREEHELPAVAEMRQTLEQLKYEGAKSVRTAAELRERAHAIADVAKRMHVGEVEYALVTREAERTLGQMLTAGREAGDVAKKEGRNVQSAARIQDLGIEKNLAADAVFFASIADDVWAETVEHARETEYTSRSSLKAMFAGVEARRVRRQRRGSTHAESPTVPPRYDVLLQMIADHRRGIVDNAELYEYALRHRSWRWD